MKKLLIYFLFILVSITHTNAQLVTTISWTENTSMPEHEVIYYKPGNKLNWDDFKGKPRLEGNVAALTMSGFGYKSEISTIGNTGQLNISIYCYFNKPLSWVKPDKKTNYILNHEQNHFNLCFIVANQFFQRLKTSSITLQNYKSLLPKLYTEYTAVLNEMQNKYDAQTRNGQENGQQMQWDNLIMDQLAAIKL
ncbi:MAG: hypothetical protein ABS68_13705 [Niastella sp. SCN 39-18]|nr:hypothetical protein [Sphingobacteriales bacterium]ODT50413.1 MAG: hypothetical protein ABS68_13705 [Niastella sp. SCN 39-18]OJW09897.1 MAG: hypothetical protein BGO53_08705 [Sphingobacteriales bacterium 39-19]